MIVKLFKACIIVIVAVNGFEYGSIRRIRSPEPSGWQVSSDYSSPSIGLARSTASEGTFSSSSGWGNSYSANSRSNKPSGWHVSNDYASPSIGLARSTPSEGNGVSSFSSSSGWGSSYSANSNSNTPKGYMEQSGWQVSNDYTSPSIGLARSTPSGGNGASSFSSSSGWGNSYSANSKSNRPKGYSSNRLNEISGCPSLKSRSSGWKDSSAGFRSIGGKKSW